MIAMILNDWDDGCVLDVWVVVGCGSLAPLLPSPSPPAPLPLLLGVLGERGVCSWQVEVLVGVWGVWEDWWLR